ncbi:MAG: diguanylate cyclase, partial [Sphingomonadales bacterium]
KWSKDELAVIGMSSFGDTNLSSRFIKMGANDFISKPFRAEELFCRINQNLDLIENVRALNNAATKDFLTGLHNRRFFFDAAESIIAGAGRSGSPVAVALLDIDKFKAVNDTFGHDAGDAVLVGLAGVLAASVRKSDIVARFGGEEFCLLLSGHDPDYLEAHFKKLLREVWANRVPHEGTELRVTASIGVVEATSNDIEALIGEADALLYQAKEAGRNRALIKRAGDEKPLIVQGSAGAPTYD